jgi:hypothetical protein
VVGLGSPGWFQRGKLEAKFKSKVAAEEAADAQAVAAAKANAAAEAAAAAVAAADAASQKRRSSTTVAPANLAPEEQEEQRWRTKFETAATGTASFELDKPAFKALVKKLLVKELMKMTDLAQPGDPPLPPPPADVDLDASFKVADADKSGLVDQEEFVKLMRLIKAGKVSGLGDTGFFGFGGGNKQKQFKEDLANAKEAETATKSAKLAQLQREAASGDEVAAAEAKAAELAEKSKVALAEAQAAQAEAAEKVEKAQALDEEFAGATRTSSMGGALFGGDKRDSTSEEAKASPPEKPEEPAPSISQDGPTSTIGGDEPEPEEEEAVAAEVVVEAKELVEDAKVLQGPDGVIMRLYEAPDGFRGSYDEVVAHEKKLGLATGSEHTVNKKGQDSNMKLYEVPLPLVLMRLICFCT